MDSWAVSACYPQRTFYSLSDGPSTRDHRITMAVFRLCSTCPSRSQAGFCHCTHRAMSDRPEPTIARLRYSLGGDRPSHTPPHPASGARAHPAPPAAGGGCAGGAARPSQTPPAAGAGARVHGPPLDTKQGKGGISRMAPRELAPALQSLPPILHMPDLVPVRSWSKGAWGLSV